MLCIRNGQIHDGIHKAAKKADILVDGGKIVKIGQNLEVPAGTEIVDVKGQAVYPGFVEAHGHIGLDGYGIGFEGTDINESNDPVAPHLRAIDGIQPMEFPLREAAAAGITTIATGPGSANVLGGTFAAIKTVGTRVDDMIVKDPVAMKCAFGENVKRVHKDKSCKTRMTNAAKLREALFKAKEYLEKKEAAAKDESGKAPAFDMKMEALIPVLKGEIPLKAHAHQLNDMFTAVRIAKEFGVKLTLEHCTEGHLAPEAFAAEGFPMAVGPSFGHASKFELRRKTWETPGVLDKAGCKVSIITDSPVTPQKYLPLCAGLAVNAGMDPFHALQAITINPAKHLGIEDRVGSIEVGKDADIVVTDGNPFHPETNVLYVWIEGTPVDLHPEETYHAI
ncbi:MAG: amidohydrolase [Lachnospiraceae bacterium]|nr:amidohydrolase [Lachnospiraceae bacterium]